HGATSSATANRLIIRDSNGRASVADPTSASHIATKGYVDGTVSSHANSTSVHGDMSMTTAEHSTILHSSGRAVVAAPRSASHIASKGYLDGTVIPTRRSSDLHGATSSATANRLIIRDSNGRASVADPTSASHIATKGYVDGLVGSLQAGTAFAYYLTI